MKFPKKVEIKHETNYKELFLCLHGMKHWLPLLQESEKEYYDLIEKLLIEDFYNDNNEKLTMKFLCTKTGYKSTQISKWLPMIYNDLFDLNYDKPELFKRQGVKHEFYIHYYDSSTFWNEWLLSTPKEWESFNIGFVKAKVGTEIFWVEKVQHLLEDNEHKIIIWLKGGFVNKYREALYDRALFEGRIGYMTSSLVGPHEVDKILESTYRGR